MTRIIAGELGGRRITVPPRGTRPTSDRVREALFSALAADPGLDGAAVLDLCAGSGALGIEALSRGAGYALFVECDRAAAATVRANLAALGLAERSRVLAAGVRPALAGPPPRRFDLVLADPPYAVGDDELAGWLAAAHAGGWLAAGATVVLERPARPAPGRAADPGRAGFGWPEPLVAVRDRRYGDTVLRWGAAPRECG